MFDDHLTKPVPGFTARRGSARIWKRVAAFLFDLIIFNLVVVAPFEPVLPAASFRATYSIATYAVVGLIVLLFLAYTVLLQYLIGATIGMLLFRLRVEHCESLWRAFVRNLFILPFFPFFLLWVVDPLYLAVTGDRLTERWSGTRTVEDG